MGVGLPIEKYQSLKIACLQSRYIKITCGLLAVGIFYYYYYSTITQLVECLTVNQEVVGSSPTCGVKDIKYYRYTLS